MKLNELENFMKKNDGYSYKVRHRITIEPDKTEGKFEELVKGLELLLWQISRIKDEIPNDYYNWLFECLVIDLYKAGVKEVHCEDNRGNSVDFNILDIVEKDICEDF